MPKTTTPSPRRSASGIRLSETERAEMETAATACGFSGNISAYLRHLHESHMADVRSRVTSFPSVPAPRLYRRFGNGKLMHGDSRGLLQTLPDRSVDLVMTSPPFGLVRKKSYGNEDADRYVDWFRPFAAGIHRVLKPHGSLVIDIGGAWKRGTPTRSLYHFELLISLCREFNFHLCEEHYWWNPTKLPTPAEWVNVRRIRVKDAVNCIWWLSPSPWPKADNRRILSPYSQSMTDLLSNGYTAKLRPSGHDISTKFQRDNGGAVPPNLLAMANTESNGAYQQFCRAHGVPVHPARYPPQIPEYFIRMLTDPNDLVVDPFAGSCVTGAVAEQLGRRWVCCELDDSYLEGATARFTGCPKPNSSTAAAPYRIHPPCALEIVSKPDKLRTGQTRPKKT